MNAFLNNLELIAVVSGAIASLLGAAIALWSAKRTREQYYKDYIQRKSDREDTKNGD